MDLTKKIHNAVFVSDRIITYKVAAALLEIDANEAKRVLEKYVQDLSKKDETINVSYVVGGITLTDQHKIRIVPQNKYDKVKLHFKTITINHVYSIQKSPLVDWTAIFNVDDFLYDKNDPSVDVAVKQEIIEPTEIKKEVKAAQPTSKKGGISNFFNNTNNQKKASSNQKSPKVAVKKETENGNHDKSKKQEKNAAFTNFFSKSNNKENVSKVNGTVKKEQISSDEDEEIFKVNKKRSRVLNDDEEDVNPTKCPKVDILDEPMEEDQQDEQFHSDEDIFGSPEKDEELMKDTEESTENEIQSSLPVSNSETTEDMTETTENNTETTEENTENSESMYQDDDGYFVTEKRKPSRKPEKTKQMTKKEATEKKKIEKEEKKTKKEVVQKIKNNTNQKSILSFFQKK